MIIPSINARDFEEVRNKIRRIESYAEWVHLDITDGRFTKHVTWNNPNDLKTFQSSVKLEAHLMVENPEGVIPEWIAAGVKRILFHIEATSNPREILEGCRRHDVEVVAAIGTETPAELLLPYAHNFTMVLFLTVAAGPSGQEFYEDSLERINFLRQHNKTVTIEVDGGINLETAKRAKVAGANIFVSGAYIFSRPDPIEAMKELENAIA
ncbi:MAG: hypothetical protein A3J67_00340 [Parcubacteria group bacterium RIFCSPHIGHO2_02_FULL_48_10b]|nr:MAG: hypothetical protein A3J67_00340 [Parcubacteria group bacterium RIFCSPHIGHO2_02_FULL_48_10b]